MQIIKSQNNIVEKVLRDKEGRLVRARFAIYENAGRIKARLIDFVYIDVKELAGKVLSLVGFSNKVSTKLNSFYKAVISPFVYSEILYFSGSKPRAPTFV